MAKSKRSNRDHAYQAPVPGPDKVIAELEALCA